MTSTVRPIIAVCGTIGREVEELSDVVRASGVFGVTPVVWPDSDALRAAHALPAAGYIALGASGPDDLVLASELAARPTSAPLLVIGGTPSALGTCWLAHRPPSQSLAVLLGQLIFPSREVPQSLPPDSDAAPRSWRRKSDMMVGSSYAMKRLQSALGRLARSMAPVLVTGESGTGKELAARALHYGSVRAAAPFIAINCGAIPEPLFEAELFGHQRGAFTGAVSARSGAFEAADRGTLLLDEIGEMPLPLQVKLLRVLETGEITRLGGNERKRLDVRVVAATNKKLDVEVQAGRFREDLFYRVNVCSLEIPPLRERPEDIPALVTHHLEEIARREQRTAPRVTQLALDKLLAHRWPGNVRELVNVIERAVLHAEGGTIDAAHVVLPLDASPLIPAYRDAKEDFERAYYTHVMRAAGGNISLVAKLAQKTRKEVYDALKRLELDAGVYRESSGKMLAVRPLPEEEPSEQGR